ncbi:hypothetical protein AAC387_Pa03g3765 [Persea americana]
MDPPSLIHGHSPNARSPAASGPSFGLADIWPLDSAIVRGIQSRRGRFGQDLGFSESVRDGSAPEESTVTEQSGRLGGGGGGRKRREVAAAAASEDEASKPASTSSGNDVTDSNGKRLKVLGSRGEDEDSKEVEASSGNGNMIAEQNAQPSEAQKQDYIHVRARRGQATDSHSLAERARREKISERMKILQDLVPGCNKVIGKAVVLDEIINYIQSLQRQVEFLSMKIEAVNTRMHPGVEGFPAKDIKSSIDCKESDKQIGEAVKQLSFWKEFGLQTFDTAGMPFTSQATRDYGQGSPPEWLHMQVGSGFERAT